MAGLPPDQMGRLKLKWAFGIPGAYTSPGQPTIAGGRLFFGSSIGKVYSVDAASGCVQWVFDAGAPVRTAITIGMLGGRWAAYFGDTGTSGAHVFAVDATSGQLIWKATADESVYAHISGSPVLAAGRLYVPVTGDEDAHAGNPEFQCCWFRGSLVALDAVTGKSIWKSYTIAEPARPRDTNSRGVRRWGPSGAGIWSAPTIDMVRRAIYVGTGDSHSQPAADTSDAILAFDMDTGAMLWSRQKTRGDAWNVACETGDPANCPEGAGPDFDFGSPPILVELAGGRRALIAGQKSGVVYALDPDNRGEELWRAVVGQGGFVGGIQSGPAVDRENVYVALSDVSSPFSSPSAPGESWLRRFRAEFGWFCTRAAIHIRSSDDGGGTFALSLESGRVWYAGPQCDGAPGCRPAQPGAVTVIPGVAFSGSIDGHLRGYSTKDGKVIWTVGTARSYSTVNGVAGYGGSLAGAGSCDCGWSAVLEFRVSCAARFDRQYSACVLD